METWEGAKERADACKENAMYRYMPRGQEQDQWPRDGQYDTQIEHSSVARSETDNRSTQEDNGEEDEEKRKTMMTRMLKVHFGAY